MKTASVITMTLIAALLVSGTLPAVAAAPPPPSFTVQQQGTVCAGDLTTLKVSWTPNIEYEFTLSADVGAPLSIQNALSPEYLSVPTPSDVTITLKVCNNANECSQSSQTVWVHALPSCEPV